MYYVRDVLDTGEKKESKTNETSVPWKFMAVTGVGRLQPVDQIWPIFFFGI